MTVNTLISLSINITKLSQIKQIQAARVSVLLESQYATLQIEIFVSNLTKNEKLIRYETKKKSRNYINKRHSLSNLEHRARICQLKNHRFKTLWNAIAVSDGNFSLHYTL